MYSFPNLEPVCCSVSGSNYCFLPCIHISQEADKVVWYSHVFKNFQQFVVIHTVKGFGIVNEAEVDVFLELPCFYYDAIQFSSVQLLSRVRLFATPWTAACQASLSITNSWSLPKHMSIESVMPSNHLISCHPFHFLPSIFPSIRVFSNESALHFRWPKYWSFSFNICPSNDHPGLISFRMNWLDLLAVQGALKSLQHHISKAQFFGAQLSL